MKQLSIAFILSALITLTSTAMAEDSSHEFSANVALTTNYMYRGISQSDEQPAISGGFDWGYTTGGFADIYAGIWASSLDLQDGDTGIEIDYYGGIAGEFTNGISWDVGGLYYQYPGTNADVAGDFDFFEVYSNLGYTFASVPLEPSLGFGVAYSPDFFGETGDGVYLSGSLDLSLPMGFGLSFLVGNQDVDGSAPGAGFNYTHYVVGLNKSLGIFDFDVSYYDTSDKADCGGEICEAVVFTVSSSF
jgi:uncharacterized protein (TIGR02001 family)